MKKKIRRKVLIYMTLQNLFFSIIAAIFIAIAWYLWKDSEYIDIIRIGIIVIGLFMVYSVFIGPALFIYMWRYEIDENSVTYQKGRLIIRRTVIPMGKIQHITTVTNPVLDKFGLVEVKIQTLTENHAFNYIDIKESEQVINNIKLILKNTYLKDINLMVEDHEEKQGE